MKVSDETYKKFELLAALTHAVEVAIKHETSLNYVKSMATLRQKTYTKAWDSIYEDFPELDRHTAHSYDHSTREVRETVNVPAENFRNHKDYVDGEPCRHPGCLQHVTHPCEGCGRIAGRREQRLKR